MALKQKERLGELLDVELVLRSVVHETREEELSPGPGTYLSQKVWEAAAPTSPGKAEHSSARRRLEL